MRASADSWRGAPDDRIVRGSYLYGPPARLGRSEDAPERAAHGTRRVQSMKTADIRSRFLTFFEERDHAV